MKFLVPMMVCIVFAETVAAQQAPPLPSAKTPELPTPSGTPEPQFRPELLPESTALPAAPLDLRLPAPFTPLGTDPAQSEHPTTQLSPEEQQKNRIRLSEIRAVAMRSPRAIELTRLADGALTDEARREFMRAYYHTLCNQMRKLEPGLMAAISDYEHTQIRQLEQGPSRLAIVARETAHRRHTRHPE